MPTTAVYSLFSQHQEAATSISEMQRLTAKALASAMALASRIVLINLLSISRVGAMFCSTSCYVWLVFAKVLKLRNFGGSCLLQSAHSCSHLLLSSFKL